MKWTKEWPSQTGWYFWRFDFSSVVCGCKYVDVSPEKLMEEMQCNRPYIFDEELDTLEWAGPITEPTK